APVAAYRNVIRNSLSNNIMSWYGHSEMAVLAYEVNEGVYRALPSYGHSEAEPSSKAGVHRLISTSLYNKVHPFIRYDTGDEIEVIKAKKESGELEFKVLDARVGEFVLDRKGY